VRSLRAGLSVVPLVAVILLAVGCGGGDVPCQETTVDWTCADGVCACDEDGTVCTRPVATDDEDPNNCLYLCEFCAE
jgi:hypothetical protein